MHGHVRESAFRAVKHRSPQRRIWLHCASLRETRFLPRAIRSDRWVPANGNRFPFFFPFFFFNRPWSASTGQKAKRSRNAFVADSRDNRRGIGWNSNGNRDRPAIHENKLLAPFRSKQGCEFHRSGRERMVCPIIDTPTGESTGLSASSFFRSVPSNAWIDDFVGKEGKLIFFATGLNRGKKWYVYSFSPRPRGYYGSSFLRCYASYLFWEYNFSSFLFLSFFFPTNILYDETSKLKDIIFLVSCLHFSQKM